MKVSRILRLLSWLLDPSYSSHFMSLKHFHYVFLFFAVLCDGGFWLWTRLQPEKTAELGIRHLGFIAGWTTLALIAYGVWYLIKKSRSIIV